MNFCTSCGSSIQKSSIFCANCGLKLSASVEKSSEVQQSNNMSKMGEVKNPPTVSRSSLWFGIALCVAIVIFQLIGHSEETYDHTSIVDNIQSIQDNLNAISFDMSDWEWYLYVYPFLAIIITALSFVSGVLVSLLRRYVAPLLLTTATLIFVDWTLYFFYLESYSQNTALDALGQISGFDYLFIEFNLVRALGHIFEKGIWLALIAAAVIGLSSSTNPRLQKGSSN